MLDLQYLGPEFSRFGGSLVATGVGNHQDLRPGRSRLDGPHTSLYVGLFIVGGHDEREHG